MMKLRIFGITLVMVIAFTALSTAVLAQEATETPVPPPTFTDGRISDIVGLGGLALYCVDANGTNNMNSFEDGAITVWGVGDQKYIELSADELRSDEEISQEPSVMEMEGEMTEEASMDEMMTEEASMMDEMMTEEAPMVLLEEPVLLARATTPNGEIGFFRVSNDDQFVLQGHDDKGAFFTYTWTGCGVGKLDHTTGAFLPELEMMPMMESTDEMGEMMTPEATANS
ncbi:MAG: hypothetical protein ABI835_15435 [Chloroflexota bacterium]